ncbi:MAG: UDP-N-acetylmuramoyl-L-alanyl-D-glutamate--2,6-diaminopimelate ligase [Bacteroidota bacterium]|nr:UDP-N-acetylmuramoyl-L-alanyl-D-glutamate--2,6-diaminopimelate ligase [Bacteroidota bacterium]MDX5506762.1 UDP-N-acetylmuramoyl-L-alanyl-D-glutamate--2,6-diaminopimelate ligase [Bacteroidota bacterium]
MKLLKDILYKVPLDEVVGSTNKAISNIHFDSRKIQKDGLFIAQKGTQVDGHEYISAAIVKGAIAVVCEELPEEKKEGVTYIQTGNSSSALGWIAANFYNNPSEEMIVVGVTGTNGKTTVATLLYQLFTDLGHKTGLLSTVRIRIAKEVLPATHTTPDAITIQKNLAEMRKAGCKYVFMEVSSHGLAQFRTSGIKFAGGIFTNITHDHLDYHGTFKEYLSAKKMLFDQLPAGAFALVNVDDKHAEQLLHHTKAKKYTYALRSPADYKGKILESQITGLLLKINDQEFWAKLVGDFNAYNLLAVYGAADQLKQDPLTILTTMSTLTPPEGRFQYIISDREITGVVDYAHTPDALENVLKTIGQLSGGTRNIITVVGCGGDRDKTKRPEMARIAAELSQKVILTSDNPRTEDPESILDDMEKGLDPVLKKKTIRVTNRREAIAVSCQLAQDGDIILVAGKGHEKYQEIHGERLPFDDLAILKENFTQTA